jgi:DNA end-binding protein Ku
MKSIWNGSISFGLVNIPVKLYSAIQERPTKTRLLHKEKLSPIRYKKWCDDCTEEVTSDEIVRGIEVAKDQYIIVSDEELKSIKPEKSSRIEIVEFVGASNIDPIYFDKHYYAGPASPKDKTFFLFRDVISETAKMAIGRFVMREKEYVCAIEAYQQGLLLTTLNYSDEIRDASEIPDVVSSVKISNAEKDLAKQLIERIEVDEFDISKFKDTFQKDLQVLLKKKAKGEKITIEEPDRPKRTTEENLIEVLKKSLKT